jgi:hypothetical protein
METACSLRSAKQQGTEVFHLRGGFLTCRIEAVGEDFDSAPALTPWGAGLNSCGRFLSPGELHASVSVAGTETMLQADDGSNE